jgi:hypothetical protein
LRDCRDPSWTQYRRRCDLENGGAAQKSINERPNCGFRALGHGGSIRTAPPLPGIAGRPLVRDGARLFVGLGLNPPLHEVLHGGGSDRVRCSGIERGKATT